MPELEAILDASRKQKYEDRKFAAALKGIDLDEGAKQEAEAAFERANRRAQARLSGKSEEEVERMHDADLFGMEFEVEE